MAVDAGVGSLVLLFAGRSLLLRIFPQPPASEVSDLLLLKQKEWGALGVALTLMLIAAARKPLRNSVIVWAMAIALVVAGAAELFSIWALNSGRLYPTSVTVMHAGIRFVFAVLLLFFLVWAGRNAKGQKT